MATHDYIISNQGFPATRADINNALSAIVSNNSNSSAPSTTYAYQWWYDVSTTTLKFRNADNDAWISFATFNMTNDTVNLVDSAIDLVNDTSPQLGGDLDVNGNQFVSTSNGNIQFTPNGTGKILFDNVAYSPTGTLTDGATINWDTSAIQVAQVTLGGNRTFAAPTNLIDGAFYALVIIQDGTGSRTATFNSVFKFAAATAPTLTTTANARDILVFQSNGTNLYESGRSLNLT